MHMRLSQSAGEHQGGVLSWPHGWPVIERRRRDGCRQDPRGPTAPSRRANCRRSSIAHRSNLSLNLDLGSPTCPAVPPLLEPLLHKGAVGRKQFLVRLAVDAAKEAAQHGQPLLEAKVRQEGRLLHVTPAARAASCVPAHRRLRVPLVRSTLCVFIRVHRMEGRRFRSRDIFGARAVGGMPTHLEAELLQKLERLDLHRLSGPSWGGLAAFEGPPEPRPDEVGPR